MNFSLDSEPNCIKTRKQHKFSLLELLNSHSVERVFLIHFQLTLIINNQNRGKQSRTIKIWNPCSLKQKQIVFLAWVFKLKRVKKSNVQNGEQIDFNLQFSVTNCFQFILFFNYFCFVFVYHNILISFHAFIKEIAN